MKQTVQKPRKSLSSAFGAGNDNKTLMAGGHTRVTFASKQKGSELITDNDDYLSRISTFDRNSKTQRNGDVSQADLVRFFGANTMEWTEKEKRKITIGINLFRDMAAQFNLPLPDEVFFVKTTGREEGGAAYTRANAIFFPEHFIAVPQERLNFVVAHEFFHVLSRTNPELRDKLYEVIGFKNSGEVELPPFLKEHKISNPDAPVHQHVIELQLNGKAHWGVPLIYSERDFDADEGKTFFQYLVHKLLVVEKDGRPFDEIRKSFGSDDARLCFPNEVDGYFEQVGKNTGYMIHPEEILAENFVHMLMKTPNLPNPEITAKMSSVLKDNDAAPLARNPGSGRGRKRNQAPGSI